MAPAIPPAYGFHIQKEFLEKTKNLTIQASSFTINPASLAVAVKLACFIIIFTILNGFGCCMFYLL